MTTEAANIEFIDKLGFLVFESARFKVAYGGRGSGKCLAIGTKVIMFDGSLKAVEDVIVGDQLMGPDSKPRNVLGTTRGFSEMYRVDQTSGMSYVVNSAHILSLKKSEACKKDKGELSKAGNYRRPNGRYPDYPDVANINVVEAYNQSERWKSNFRGYRAGLINFPEKEVLIDPWYLGAWLGDGKSNDTIIYSEDVEVLKACDDLANKLNMRVSIYEQPRNKCVGIKIARYDGTLPTSYLRSMFHHYELFDNKHIPHEYVANSEEIRLQLLAGLLDTDGHLCRNGYEITQVNKRLAEDIKFLADGLGFRTNFSVKNTICTNNGVRGIAYRISINGDTWRIPCKIARKRVNKNDVRKNKDFLLSQIEITPVGFGEYAGFSLDGDHLFLLEDGTVTHNTEGAALALVLLSGAKKLRILCARELQNSIDESSKATLEAWIIQLGLEDEFDIQHKKIVNKRTGSEFLFYGLRYNINKLKSLGRIDIVWIDEAGPVSKTVWDKLEPTIRGRSSFEADQGGPFGVGPEIWVTFNPELDTDETYKRFVLKKDLFYPDYVVVNASGDVLLTNDGKFVQELHDHPSAHKKIRYAIVTKINWQDNKFFPPDLRMQMSVMQKADPTRYLEIWEGHTKQVVDGAIYAEELRSVLKEGRRGKVPYDPSKPVYTFWDLGHSDKTAIWFIQRAGMYYNVINYYENRLQKLEHYLIHMRELGYNYGRVYQPHDADNETLASRSISKLTRDAGFEVTVVQRPSKKAVGINAARQVLPLCNFDEANTSDGWQCLSRYAYKVDEDTGQFSREPAHDTPWSHGCFTGDTQILTREGLRAISTLPETGEVWTLLGWKPYQNPHLTRKNAPVVEVYFKNGYSVRCTPDHLFLTESGWKSAECLERGLQIQFGSMRQRNSLITRFIDCIKAKAISKPMGRYTDMCGQTLLDQYQKTVIFITEMKLNLIALLKTLNVYHGKSISVSALNCLSSEEKLFTFQKMPEMQHPFGIDRKKVENGTENTRLTNNLAIIENEPNLIVLNAVTNLRQKIKRHADVFIAQLNAVMQSSEKHAILAVTGKRGIAKNVAKSLQILRRAVHLIKDFVAPNAGKLIIESVKKLDQVEDVYCLTVPDVGHFSLANGAIVKNCDAFQTFALSLKTEHDAKKPKRSPNNIIKVIPPRNSWMGAV